MNADRDLINQIQKLKEIKPNAEWSALLRAQIVGQNEKERRLSFLSSFKNLFFQYRLAFGAAAILIISGGVIIASQNSLPGQPLYAVKRVTEKVVTLLPADNHKIATANLELAAKRLEEIDLLSQKNMVKNLPVALKEYETIKSEAKKEVVQQITKDPQNAVQIIKNAALAMKNIDDKEKQVYGALGVDRNATTTNEGNNDIFDKTIISSLIAYLDGNNNLSNDQLKDLAVVQELYAQGNYRQALETYLNSSLNK